MAKPSKRSAFRQLCCPVLLCLLPASGAADSPEQPTASAAQLRSLELIDVNGQKHVPFADESTVAAVLVFVSVDCPVANTFQPALRRIDTDYRRQGICCFQIHSSAQTMPERIKQHVSDYEIITPVVQDATQTIARNVAARVTPEAVIVDRAGRIRYRGLINNLYAGYGKKRRRPTAHFLTDALDAVLADRPVDVRVTKPVGCFIHYEENEQEAE